MHALLLVVCMASAPAQYDADDDDYEEVCRRERLVYESRRRGIRLELSFDRERSSRAYEAPRRPAPRYEAPPRHFAPPPRQNWAYEPRCPDGRCPPQQYSNGYGYGYANGYGRPERAPYVAPPAYGGRCPPPGVRESFERR
jgi:hypothetical protein